MLEKMTIEEFNAWRDQQQVATTKANREALAGQSEHEIQAACVKWFYLQYGPPRALLVAIPNGAHLSGSAKVRAIKMQKLKAEGLVTGAADLMLIHLRGVVFLECKTPKGRMSDAQKAFQDDVERLGQPYFVFRSLEEFQEIVNQALF